MEVITNKEIIEWGIDIPNRTTEKMITNQEIKQDINEGKITIINLTGPSQLQSHSAMKGVDLAEAKEIFKILHKRNNTVIFLSTTPITSREKDRIQHLKTIENPFGQQQPPMQAQGHPDIYIEIWGAEREDKINKMKQIILLVEKSTKDINNMYKPMEDPKDKYHPWHCPLCKQRGERLSQFGVCRNNCCMGVRTQNTHRDRTETHRRKIETVLIGGKNKLHTGKNTRVFWSDGSGEHEGVQETGWGLVECSQSLNTDGTITIKKQKEWLGKSKMLDWYSFLNVIYFFRLVILFLSFFCLFLFYLCVCFVFLLPCSNYFCILQTG